MSERIHLDQIIERWSAITGLEDWDFGADWWRSRCRDKGIHLDADDTAPLKLVDKAIGPPPEPPGPRLGVVYCRGNDKQRKQQAAQDDRIPVAKVKATLEALLREPPTPEALGVFMAEGGLSTTEDEQHLLRGHREGDIFRAWEKAKDAVRARQYFTRHNHI